MYERFHLLWWWGFQPVATSVLLLLGILQSFQLFLCHCYALFVKEWKRCSNAATGFYSVATFPFLRKVEISWSRVRAPGVTPASIIRVRGGAKCSAGVAAHPATPNLGTWYLSSFLAIFIAWVGGAVFFLILCCPATINLSWLYIQRTNLQLIWLRNSPEKYRLILAVKVSHNSYFYRKVKCIAGTHATTVLGNHQFNKAALCNCGSSINHKQGYQPGE